MTPKVSVEFADAACLVRWRALKGDLSDALAGEVERADALTEHIANRLHELSGSVEDDSELYALALVAESIRQRHALIVQRVKALCEAGGED